jgi:hypothetical protein
MDLSRFAARNRSMIARSASSTTNSAIFTQPLKKVKIAASAVRDDYVPKVKPHELNKIR